MFNRKFAARDRRKPRGLICKVYMEDRARFRDERQAPLPDVGHDAVDLGMIDDHLDEYYRRLISPEVWARYTTIVPFCTVPEGGTDPKKQGGRTMPRNYFRKPTEIKAEKALLASFSKESAAKLSDELPPVPTQAELIARAGGRTIAVPNTTEVADWHEQVL